MTNMTKSPDIGLYPLNDCVLVELKQSSKNFSVKEGKYDSRTEGIVVNVPAPMIAAEPIAEDEYGEISMIDANEWHLGKRIHFEEFKEGARI